MEKLPSPTPELTTAEIISNSRAFLENANAAEPGKKIPLEERLTNILEAARRIMNMGEIEEILASDGGVEVGYSSIGATLKTSETCKRLGRFNWIHAAYYTAGMEIAYEGVERQAVYAALQAGGVISLEMIHQCVEGWRSQKVQPSFLKTRIQQAIDKGNLRCLGPGLYIHADNCENSVSPPLEKVKRHIEDLFKEKGGMLKRTNILRLLREGNSEIMERHMNEALSELRQQGVIKPIRRGQYVHTEQYTGASIDKIHDHAEAEARQLVHQKYLGHFKKIHGACNTAEERAIIEFWMQQRVRKNRRLSPDDIEALNAQIFKGAGWGPIKIKRVVQALETELTYLT